MTRRKNAWPTKTWQANRDGRQKQADIICTTHPLQKENVQPNGWRYPLVGGTRSRRFDGTNFKPRKLPENAQTPTCRVHALLDRMAGRKNQQTRKMFLGRGTKHCWQAHTAKTPADIMTRLRARRHNQKNYSQRNQLDNHDC